MRYQELFEAVKPPEYPAKARYDHFNKMLFNGELPEIPIQFKKMKGVGGRVDARVKFHPNAPRWNKYYGATLIPGTMKMTLSNCYLRTTEQQDAILLHEMIHVHFDATGDFAEDHGAKFIKMAREIGAKVGFEIPLKDEVSDLVVADTTVKPLIVMVVTRKHGGRLYAALSPSVLNKMDDFRAGVDRLYFGAESSITIYKIATPAWSDFAVKNRIQRSTKPQLYVETEKRTALLDELERDGQIIEI